jgi:hypothetical protein
MPVNTFKSNLKVETNVGGELVDNDEYQATKANAEHQVQLHSENLWSQSYVSPDEQALQDLYNKEVKVEEDLSLIAANKQDLKIKGLRP